LWSSFFVSVSWGSDTVRGQGRVAAPTGAAGLIGTTPVAAWLRASMAGAILAVPFWACAESSVGSTVLGELMAKYKVMKLATTTTAGPAITIHTWAKDHHGDDWREFIEARVVMFNFL